MRNNVTALRGTFNRPWDMMYTAMLYPVVYAWEFLYCFRWCLDNHIVSSWQRWVRAHHWNRKINLILNHLFNDMSCKEGLKTNPELPSQDYKHTIAAIYNRREQNDIYCACSNIIIIFVPFSCLFTGPISSRAEQKRRIFYCSIRKYCIAVAADAIEFHAMSSFIFYLTIQNSWALKNEHKNNYALALHIALSYRSKWRHVSFNPIPRTAYWTTGIRHLLLTPDFRCCLVGAKLGSGVYHGGR